MTDLGRAFINAQIAAGYALTSRLSHHWYLVLVFVILQSDAHALGLAEGCAATASCTRIRNHHGHTNSVRVASSLRADMIFGKDKASALVYIKPCGGFVGARVDRMRMEKGDGRPHSSAADG